MMKDRIDAGEFPKDERGFYLVPRRNGNVALILSTKGLGDQPIVGYSSSDQTCIESWGADGRYFDSESPLDLVAP